MDETRAPVLDPGRGRTKTGWLWALARDDRAWSGPNPPGVMYFYAPGRGGEYAEKFLKGFDGILQMDGYAGYNRLTGRGRKQPHRRTPALALPEVVKLKSGCRACIAYYVFGSSLRRPSVHCSFH